MIINLTLSGVSPTVLADINTYWLSQIGAHVGTSGANLDATTTNVVVTVSQALLPAAQPLPAAGTSVLIGAEPMLITGADGLTLTLQRGVFPENAMVAHAIGEAVTPMLYQSGFQMCTVPLRSWFLSIAQQLGAQSATLGATVTGSITL